ncbi:MAG TPA: BrnT family toxin [Stellaceae bacterium]|nr:BrnT family toxin [Stellaceae bacterium]
MDGFEWDPDKEAKNIAERGIDFTTAAGIWGGRVLEQIDDRRDYGEVRVQASGEVDGRPMVVVFTWRGTTRRIISARKANPREERRFEAETHGRRTAAQD